MDTNTATAYNPLRPYSAQAFELLEELVMASRWDSIDPKGFGRMLNDAELVVVRDLESAGFVVFLVDEDQWAITADGLELAWENR